MSDVKICTPEETGVPSDIIICDEESISQPGDIVVCDGDERISDCEKYSAVLVSGDEDCTVGDIYTVSGGKPPYRWSFDSGSIDKDGEILSIDGCGASGSSRVGYVTVTDSCDNSSRILVRLPSGYWNEIWRTDPAYNIDCVNNTTNCGATTTLALYSGNQRIEKDYRCCFDKSAPQCESTDPALGSCSRFKWYLFKTRISLWECP